MDLVNLIDYQDNWNFSLFEAFDNHIITLTTRLTPAGTNKEDCNQPQRRLNKQIPP